VDVELLPAPGLTNGPADLRRYGEALADRLRAGPPVDLLVGLSVGAQAAAVAKRGRLPRRCCGRPVWRPEDLDEVMALKAAVETEAVGERLGLVR
jgi:hypothetical protein